MTQFGDQLRERAHKNLCFKKIVDTYKEQMEWINQNKHENSDLVHEEVSNQQQQQLQHQSEKQLLSMEEERYFDEEEATPPDDLAVSQVDEQQQLQKDKEKMLRKSILKEKMLRKYSKEDDEDDIWFPLAKTKVHTDGIVNLKNDENNNGNNEGSISSSSSLVNNLNLININEQEGLSNQQEISQFLILGGKENDEEEKKMFSKSGEIIKNCFEIELEDILKKESFECLSNCSNESKYNLKRSLREREQESDEETLGEITKRERSLTFTEGLRLQKNGEQPYNDIKYTYNIIYSGEGQDPQAILRNAADEIIQKKVKVD